MAEDAILIKTVADNVATLQLNRPEARNALSEEMRDKLIETLEQCEADDEVRCVVIAGDDDYFVAGADIKLLRDTTTSDMLASRRTTSLWQALTNFRKPVIAAVSGYALGGGCELALGCDMIVASESAEFGLPEVTLGIIPGGGGTQRLTRVVGKQRAMELVLTGKRISAAEAAQLGLVTQLVNPKEWLSAAQELAAVVARRPPLAVLLAKQAVLAAEEMPMSAALEHERRLFELAMSTEDRIEGMDAFLEKRRPEFRGK